MALPTTKTAFRRPVLVALDDGSDHWPADIRASVAEQLNLTASDLAQMPRHGPTKVFVNFVAWALAEFGPAGLTEGSQPGPYRISDLGRAALAKHPTEVDLRWPALQKLRDQVDSARRTEPPRNDEHLTWHRTIGPDTRVAPLEAEPGRMLRRARPFDPQRAPNAATLAASMVDRDETFVVQEKARQAHHRLLVDLFTWLVRSGWTALEEMPTAIDLRGCSPDGVRVIFEAKTITVSNEMSQCRGAFAQLVEYRMLYGRSDDSLCVVVDAAVTTHRADICERLATAVVMVDSFATRGLNDRGRALTDG